ncbi:MAG TPA: hypothetical protein VFX87_03175 [Methylomirabilota bacterium]|nr:hypothetical protein [Methylomirabilota bacterium]
MARRWLILDILIGAVGCLLAAGLIRELSTARPLPAPPAARPAPSTPVSAPAPASQQGAQIYGGIATKNLFHPGRSEALAGPVVATGSKPLLHGLVMDGPKSRAYLEDPVAKRTFGYAVGDTVGSGRLQSISHDRVVIAGPDGPTEVLLQDASKPKPVATPGLAGAPSQVPPVATAAPVTPTQPGAGAPAASPFQALPGSTTAPRARDR